MDFCPCDYSLKKSNYEQSNLFSNGIYPNIIFQILSQNTKLRVKVAYTGWQNCAPFGSNYLNSIGLTRHLDCRFWVKILNPFFHLVLCSIFTFMLKFIFKISASEPSAPRFITQNLILKRNKKNVSLNFFLHQIFSKGLWDM